MERFQITKQGYLKLKAELENLKNVERPAVINQISAARELGDLKENAEYHSAKDKQGFVEAQIADLESKFLVAEVVDIEKLSGDIVHFGATVSLENLDNGAKVSYKIVSDFESDIDSGMISNISPVGRALLGKKVGDEVEVMLPSRTVLYEILKVEYV